MTLRSWTWDEVTPAGTTLTTGNTRSNDNAAPTSSGVSNGTPTLRSSALAIAGTLSAEFVAPGGATSSCYHRLPFVGGATNVAVAGFHRMDILPAGTSMVIATLRHSAGATMRLVVTTSNKLQIQSGTGTVLATSADSYVAGQWNRLEVVADTVTGNVSFRAYVGNTATLIAEAVGTGLAISSPNALTHMEIGTPVTVQSALVATVTQWWDLLRMDDGATAELGPVANTPPTVSVTGNQNVTGGATVNLSATASDSDGAIASYLWEFLFPTSGAPALTGASTANVSFTAGSAPQTYILRCTVTDQLGGTASATTEVRVPAAGSTAQRPLPQNSTGAGAWTRVGGSATDGQALSDESDATYLESPTISGTPAARRNRVSATNAKTAANVLVKLWTDTGSANATVRLYEGATLRQTWNQAITSTPTEYTLAVTTPANITDWGNLYVDVVVTT